MLLDWEIGVLGMDAFLPDKITKDRLMYSSMEEGGTEKVTTGKDTPAAITDTVGIWQKDPVQFLSIVHLLADLEILYHADLLS